MADTQSDGAVQAETFPVKWSSGTQRPKLRVPAGATDCHHHIYDSRFPAAPNMTVEPGDSTVADYRALQQRLGTTRSVIVQPSAYGTDNRCALDALAAFGPAARAVAVVDTSVTDATLARLHEAGVRGIRFNLVQVGATTPAMLEPLGQRVHALGWHIQLNIAAPLIVEIAGLLGGLPCPVVFDHLAHGFAAALPWDGAYRIAGPGAAAAHRPELPGRPVRRQGADGRHPRGAASR
ncbi:MAG: amidohydrolase family protein [Acetobacteraceae bacterium]